MVRVPFVDAKAGQGDPGIIDQYIQSRDGGGQCRNAGFVGDFELAIAETAKIALISREIRARAGDDDLGPGLGIGCRDRLAD
jgi:hypothetical protein